jgi:hypothetical protein
LCNARYKTSSKDDYIARSMLQNFYSTAQFLDFHFNLQDCSSFHEHYMYAPVIVNIEAS